MSRMRTNEFTLTAEHIALLRRAYVSWQDCETGAPEINPKRPYGNSWVPGDVARILGWTLDASDEGLSDAQQERASVLHQETGTALQIILATGSFEPGLYRRAGEYNDWVAVPPLVEPARP